MIKNTVLGVGQRARALLAGFTPGQKAMTVIALVGLVVGGMLFMQWSGKPAYGPLFSNLSTADAGAIVEQLDSAGVAYELTDGGTTILVPQEKVYDTRLKMSTAGLPSGNQDGYALLDKQGITTSEFMQQVGYQRALEGELARTIMAIDGVQGATVHLAMPAKDVFADDEAAPTASVLVSMRSGSSLSTGQVQAVVNLVAASVPKLATEAVTVADGSGRVLSGGDGTAADGAAATREQQTRAFEDRLSVSAQGMLDQLTGSGHSVVRVSADLDFDQRNTRSTTYQYGKGTPPLEQNTSTETYTGPASGTSGVVGSTTTGASGASGAASSYGKTTTQNSNAVGSTVEERRGAPGSVRRLSVAVLLDARTAGTLDPTRVTQLVSSALGLNLKRGDTIQVEPLPFNTTDDNAAKQAAEAETAATQRAALLDLVKQVAVGVLVLAVLVLALLSSRRQRRTLVALDKAQLAGGGAVQVSRLDGPGAAGAEGEPAAVEAPARPELGQSETDAMRREAVRDDIGELVQRQPDEVAQLLRGWLADRRR